MSDPTEPDETSYFDEIPDAIVVVDEEGIIRRCNGRVADILGYRQSDLMGEPIEVLVPSTHRENHPDLHEAFVRDPDMRPMGLGKDLVARRKDGSEVPVDIGLNPIETDDGLYILASIRDITDRKALEEDRSMYQGAFEQAMDAMVVADDEGRYLAVNDAACEMFDLDREELLGKRVSDFAPEDFDFAAAWTEFNQSQRERGTFPLVTANGDHRVVEYSASTDIIPGYHLSVLRDVTEREERNQQLRVINTVLRHNLRNNMNVIQGNAVLIQGQTDEYDEETERIIRTSEKLLRTVDKAREITRFLSDPPKQGVIDLVPMIETCVEAARNRHPEADISVEMPDTARVEATRWLDEGITELIENAIEFTDQPTPEVLVTVRAEADTMVVEVADTGPGIPQMEIDLLTGRRETQPLYHGSGFGLWLVYQIVRQSRGDLSFRDNTPRGSVVSISLRAAS